MQPYLTSRFGCERLL